MSEPIKPVERVIEPKAVEPTWIPVSQCDLKPEEPFWYLELSKILIKPEGMINPAQFFYMYPGITHFMRALPPYAIPKPPVVEKDDDAIQVAYETATAGMSIKHKMSFERGWYACRAALDKGKDEK